MLLRLLSRMPRRRLSFSPGGRPVRRCRFFRLRTRRRFRSAVRRSRSPFGVRRGRCWSCPLRSGRMLRSCCVRRRRRRLCRLRSGITRRLGAIRLRVRRRPRDGRWSSGLRSSRNNCRDWFAFWNRFRRRKRRRTTFIDRRKLLAVLSRLLPRLHLRGHRRNALLARGRNFRPQRAASHASGPVVAVAVIGNVDGRVIDDDCIRDRAVINLNVGDCYVVDATVVVEAISLPVPTLIPDSLVAVSIINAPVVADMPAPIAVMVAVPAADKSPISRRPQVSRLRRPCPGARHPVVPLRCIAPISRRPQIAIPRAVRLRILRQLWRRLLSLQHRLPVA